MVQSSRLQVFSLVCYHLLGSIGCNLSHTLFKHKDNSFNITFLLLYGSSEGCGQPMSSTIGTALLNGRSLYGRFVTMLL